MIDTVAQKAQPPPGSAPTGKGGRLAVSPETEAAFEALVATLLSPLLIGQQPVQVVAATAPAPAHSSVVAAATVATETSPRPGQGMVFQGQTALPNTQGTGTGMLMPVTALASLRTEGMAAPQQPEGMPALQQPSLAVNSNRGPVVSVASAALAAPGVAVAPVAPAAPAVAAPSQQMPFADTAAVLASLRTMAANQAGQTPTPVVEPVALQHAAANLSAGMPSARGGEAAKPEAPAPSPTGAQPAVTALGVELPVAMSSVQATAPSAETAAVSPSGQIAEQVQVMLNEGENSATIRLRPEELGGVRIRLQLQDGQLHVSIQTEKAQTGRLLDQRMGELRQTLESSGLKLGDLAVSAGGRSQPPGSEALGREALQPLKTMGMEMGGNPSNPQQQAHEQQALFNGQGGNGQRERMAQPNVAPGIGAQGNPIADAPIVAGEQWGWRQAAAGVDYYA